MSRLKERISRSWEAGEEGRGNPARLKGLASRHFRSGLMVVVLGTIWGTAGTAEAQQTAAKPLIGRRVVQKANDFALHIEDRVVDRKRVIHFYRVELVEGPWLWVRAEANGFSGWALSSQVVAVDEAVDFFTRQIRENPADIFPYVMRAMVWQDRKQIADALRDYDEALRLDRTRAWVYNNRGVLHMQQKDYEKALADFDQALRLEPGGANVYNNRGTLRRTRKMYDLALADFSEAIRLNPEYAFAYYNRGLTRAERKEYDLAVADFNEVVRLDPGDAMAYYHRGLAWFAKEQYEGAIRDYDRAIELEKDLAFVYRDRGAARAARKEYVKAIAIMTRPSACRPGPRSPITSVDRSGRRSSSSIGPSPIMTRRSESTPGSTRRTWAAPGCWRAAPMPGSATPGRRSNRRRRPAS